MEDFEESKSDCCLDSNELPPMPPLMKSRRNMLKQSSREYGPSSVSPSASNFVEENMKKASCMRSASLENKEDTSNIPPEYTSSIFPVSSPPLIKWTRNAIPSASIPTPQPDFEQTFPTAGKSEKDKATSSTPPEMEDVEKQSKRTSAFSAYGKRVSPAKPTPQFGMDVLTPATASYTGVSARRTRGTWKEPDGRAMPVECRPPIGQISVSSKIVAQNQGLYKRSKCKTLQRCQFCQKEFKQVSRLRQHEHIHTEDASFKCDVCGKSFTRSDVLCVHKRTHSGDRPFKCDVCGKSFTRSDILCGHKRTHTRDRPFKCDVCGMSFSQSGNLWVHKRIHTGEKPHK